MANTNLKTRIKLRYLQASELGSVENKALLAGEVALVYVPGSTKEIEIGGVKQTVETSPAVLMKVGTGESGKTFKDLPWLTAPAADVQDWAKVSEAERTEIIANMIATAIEDTAVTIGASENASADDKTYYGIMKAIDNAEKSAEDYTDSEIQKVISTYLIDEDETNTIISHLNEVLDWFKDDQTSGVASLVKRITDAESDIDDIDGRLTTAEGDIGELESKVTANTNAVNGLSVAKLSKSDLGNYASLATLTATQVSDVKKIAGINTKVTNLGAQADATDEKVATLSTQAIRKMPVGGIDRLCNVVTIAVNGETQETVNTIILDGGSATTLWD